MILASNGFLWIIESYILISLIGFILDGFAIFTNARYFTEVSEILNGVVHGFLQGLLKSVMCKVIFLTRLEF